MMNILRMALVAGIALCTAARPSSAQTAPPQPVTDSRTARPGDQVSITAMDVEELNGRTFRIDDRGVLDLPLIGGISVSGQTVTQIQRSIVDKLKTYVRSPQVLVSLTPLQTDTVFLVGAFKSPGAYPLARAQRLSEVLISVGGLTANASRRLKITRRLSDGTIDLPSKVENPDAGTVSVEVTVSRLLEVENPSEDITVRANDTITALRAETSVFVSGAVGRPGSYPLEDRDSISVVQLLALAGGVGPEALPAEAKVLRPVLDTARRAEVPINLALIMNGRAADFTLTANDVLVVPRRSGLKANLGRIGLVAVPTVITTVLLTVVR